MEMNEDVDVGKEFTSSFHPAAGAQKRLCCFICVFFNKWE